MNNKISVIFFASGDFAIPTLKDMLLTDGGFDIRGIVTSKDKVVHNDKRIEDIASENNIPCIIPKSEKELIDFICNIPIDDEEREHLFYCVISYKKLSNEVLRLVHNRAINIHASVLPCLRGAAPINWAIRLGFKQTGLTAFKLSDKIDCGDILQTKIVNIEDSDNYESLFKKLSNECVEFTRDALRHYDDIANTLAEDAWVYKQPCLPIKSNVFVAPKIDSHYWDKWLCMNDTDIDRLFKSTSNGLPCKMYVVNKDDDRDFYEYNVKIWDYTFATDNGEYTDYKHYLNIPLVAQKGTVLSIREIQLEGKKRLPIDEFLRGFKYTRNGESEYKLEFSTELDN